MVIVHSLFVEAIVMRKTASFVFLLMASYAVGGIQSQWRGMNRDGIYPDKNLLDVWPAEGPKLLWSAEDIGQGFSSVSVTQDAVFITGSIEGEGHVFAFDKNGKQLWKAAYGPDFDGDYPGSRTTPTVVDGKLYVVSGKGHAVCLDVQSGKKIWSVDLVKACGAEIPQWGFAESPLIDGDRMICTPGGARTTVIALNRNTGEEIWKSESVSETAAYCSPLLVEHGQARLVVTMTARSIVGVNASTGELLWKYPHITDWDVNANTPIYKDGTIYCTSGYGTGSVQLRLSQDGNKVTEVWRNPELDSQHEAAVLVDGFIYGTGMNSRGWKCLDWKTGQTQNAAREITKANVIWADGKFYSYSERGYLSLIKADEKGVKVVSTFRITMGSDQHWAHPVIADGRLYVRHGNTLMVYQIAK